MAYIKKQEEIEKIIVGGKIIGEILEKLSSMAKPGVSAFEIDLEAEKLIRLAGGRPAFKGYKSRKHDPPFPTTICACVNEELVHGIATKDKVFKNGDIFTIDIGMEYEQYFTDTAITVIVGDVPKKTKQLLWTTQEALEVGIEQCVAGKTVADIGRAIEKYVKNKGNYGIVRDLVGHGVGHEVHEDPRVPNYYDPNLEKWELRPGVVIAIEPMLTLGSHQVITADDGWSISTADKSLCAHFEHTVIITEGEPIVVTRRPGENQLKTQTSKFKTNNLKPQN